MAEAVSSWCGCGEEGRARRHVLDLLGSDPPPALGRAARTIQRLLEVEGSVVAHDFFARLDVADGDFELQLARSDAVRRAAVIHEPTEIPAQDPIAVAVDPGIPAQLRLAGLTDGLGLPLIDDLIQRI